jgi:hypothetical protein
MSPEENQEVINRTSSVEIKNPALGALIARVAELEKKQIQVGAAVRLSLNILMSCKSSDGNKMDDIVEAHDLLNQAFSVLTDDDIKAASPE